MPIIKTWAVREEMNMGFDRTGGMTMRNPVPMTSDQAAKLSSDMIDDVKRPACSFYNECLTQAVRSDWIGFGCGQCTAFQHLPQDQREQDMVALLALNKALDLLAIGQLTRKRGAKEGADNKQCRRSIVVLDPSEEDDTEMPESEDAEVDASLIHF